MGQGLSRLARAGEVRGPLLLQVGADLGRCVVEQAPFDVDGLGLGDLLFGRVKIALGHLFPGFVQQPDGVLLDVGSDGHVAGPTAGWVPGLDHSCDRRGFLHRGSGRRRGSRGRRRGSRSRRRGSRGRRRGSRGRRRACSVGCGQSRRDCGLDLGEFLEIRIERGLFVLLKLITVHLSSFEILCGQLEIPAVEKPGSSFEIPDRRHWRGLATRRRWR